MSMYSDEEHACVLPDLSAARCQTADQAAGKRSTEARPRRIRRRTPLSPSATVGMQTETVNPACAVR